MSHRRGNLGTIDALLRLLYRYPCIASRLNLTCIAVINDFISMDEGAIFIGKSIGLGTVEVHVADDVVFD